MQGATLEQLNTNPKISGKRYPPCAADPAFSLFLEMPKPLIVEIGSFRQKNKPFKAGCHSSSNARVDYLLKFEQAFESQNSKKARLAFIVDKQLLGPCAAFVPD